MAGRHNQETNSSDEHGGGIGKTGRTRCHTRRKRENEKYGNKNEVGPDTVKPISIELGGRPGTQTISVLQSMTTKLAEARSGELNAATTLRKRNSLSKEHWYGLRRTHSTQQRLTKSRQT